jgi:hypothetical protein
VEENYQMISDNDLQYVPTKDFFIFKEGINDHEEYVETKWVLPKYLLHLKEEEQQELFEFLNGIVKNILDTRYNQKDKIAQERYK